MHIKAPLQQEFVVPWYIYAAQIAHGYALLQGSRHIHNWLSELQIKAPWQTLSCPAAGMLFRSHTVMPSCRACWPIWAAIWTSR